jgi:hypothetical protein
VADGWVLVCSERKVLVAGDWFVVREKYCWLVADKPSEQCGRLVTMPHSNFLEASNPAH